MRRKATRQSPEATAAARRLYRDLAEAPCCVCGRAGPSIVDHLWGSAWKLRNGLESVHVGPWAVLPYCAQCDSVKTQGSRRAHERVFGESQLAIWCRRFRTDERIPENVRAAMLQAFVCSRTDRLPLPHGEDQ